MKTTGLSDEELRGVFAVPALARKADPRRTIDFGENDRLVRHLSRRGSDALSSMEETRFSTT